MPPSARFLAPGVERPPPPLIPSPGQTTNIDLVVILVSLLCAMVSVAGLTLVVRCFCSGRFPLQAAAPGKGLEKEALRRLPKVSYGCGEGEGDGPAAECPICLAEFEEGDQLRVLPQCGHGFHEQLGLDRVGAFNLVGKDGTVGSTTGILCLCRRKLD
ncbi:hypothetical protein ZIOFF_022252 [Zingiber officinale]|uniref:RING-type domain-containing protein n=1 Tax=Zingiber officinale TaxID=94328 RepID=A0A8J5H1B5_ZINOF|nr:hypothetical protein ZIOFF_022252 [Zingiber officinale]